MGRTAEAEHQVVGEVDQRRDRALARAGQAILQPLRRRAIGHPADDPAVEGRATLRIVGADLDRAGEAALDTRCGDRLERAEAGGREVARDAVDAHAVRPVRGDRHVEHRRRTMVFGEGRADRCVARQLDDTIVVLAELELAGRTHHPVRFDPAHRGDLEHHAVHRHRGARQAEHADQPGPGIGRAADDLQRIALTGVDRQHLELVGIGVRRCGEDLGDTEAGKPRGGIVNPLDLEPDRVECRGDLRDGGRGVEVVLEPGKREFHDIPAPYAGVPTPPDRVGTSSAEKP